MSSTSQTGFTDNCCNPGVIATGNGVGRDVVIEGITTYITGDNPDKLILFCSDGFGYPFPNNRTLAG